MGSSTGAKSPTVQKKRRRSSSQQSNAQQEGKVKRQKNTPSVDIQFVDTGEHGAAKPEDDQKRSEREARAKKREEKKKEDESAEKIKKKVVKSTAASSHHSIPKAIPLAKSLPPSGTSSSGTSGRTVTSKARSSSSAKAKTQIMKCPPMWTV